MPISFPHWVKHNGVFYPPNSIIPTGLEEENPPAAEEQESVNTELPDGQSVDATAEMTSDAKVSENKEPSFEQIPHETPGAIPNEQSAAMPKPAGAAKPKAKPAGRPRKPRGATS